ncbi:DNA/RNA polymerase [Fomitiporia mediterranea MF3/22]|uniref:DNA/RNA polymerase n=1 Tax=Fomitiporia mediterranea (strain MF3/22) TaxID=694068 RepID=UPI0004408F2A|nr:DNA/RNA polymerase [Fomitiporia mediterranea MF3/22]EJD02943.1 DNA/RNA polymerase [Fomitiporia mediterranea MF3/22]
MSDDDEEAQSLGQSQDPSFLRRLAGPSAHKVGYGIDQAEINRRIAEASKGSKFYENEKRRDADWTERINKLLERRDELLRESDIARVEAKVDRVFAEKESRRDLSQTIVHVDMDAFFANVELQHNPDLKDKPFAVVGLGVVTTGSYDARKFGVRAGQPEYIAKRLCPDLILVPVDYKRVAVVSEKVMDVCKRYDPNMYIAGCDEAYLNITKHLEDHKLSAAECVEELRSKICEETNLTASAGIAPNMMLAKICSDRNKPNGQFQMPFTREAVMEFMRDLPVRKVPGIGRVGERVLEAIGVKTCGDIRAARAIIWLMPRKFAVDFLFETHLGLAPTVVKPYQREERKSVGVSRTFRAVQTKEAIFQKLEYIASLLERDLETEGWVGKIVILTYKLDTFRVHTRRATFERWISKKEDLFNIGKDLIKPYLPLRVRLLGLRVTDLIDLRAPTDQGIKRYFGSERDEGSPSKRRKLTPQTDISNEASHSPSKHRTTDRLLEGSIFKPIVVDEEENEEEELVGEAGEDEDELEEEDDHLLESELPVTAQDEQDSKHMPSFRYRGPVGATGSVVKIGNDKPKTKPSPKKPSSTHLITPSRPDSPPPQQKRSKSEQPLPDRENSKSRTHGMGLNASDANRAASAQPSSSSRDAPATVSPGQRHEAVMCPICSRELETDNSGLNAHIDFCLSRRAIMEASAAAVSTIPVLQARNARKFTDKGKGTP